MNNAQVAMLAASNTMNPMNYSSLYLKGRAEEILAWLKEHDDE